LSTSHTQIQTKYGFQGAFLLDRKSAAFDNGSKFTRVRVTDVPTQANMRSSFFVSPLKGYFS